MSEESRVFYSKYQVDEDFSDFWKRNLSNLVNCRSLREVMNHKGIDVPIKIFFCRDTFGYFGRYFTIDGNIIGPKILGNSTGLSSFWVVFAIMVFGGLWGFPGMLLGVPLMAVIYYITQKCVRYFLRKRGLAEDTQSYVYMTSVDERTNRLLYERKNGKKRALQEEEKDGEKDQEETSGEMR